MFDFSSFCLIVIDTVVVDCSLDNLDLESCKIIADKLPPHGNLSCRLLCRNRCFQSEPEQTWACGGQNYSSVFSKKSVFFYQVPFAIACKQKYITCIGSMFNKPPGSSGRRNLVK